MLKVSLVPIHFSLRVNHACARTQTVARYEKVQTDLVEGGLLSEPCSVTLEGPGKKYLLVKKKSPWLCMAASGITYSKCPLHRTKLVDIFGDVLNAGPDEVSLGVPDKMKSLMTSMSGANTSAPAASTSSALAAASPLPIKGCLLYTSDAADE